MEVTKGRVGDRKFQDKKRKARWDSHLGGTRLQKERVDRDEAGDRDKVHLFNKY